MCPLRFVKRHCFISYHYFRQLLNASVSKMSFYAHFQNTTVIGLLSLACWLLEKEWFLFYVFIIVFKGETI